MKSGSGFSQSIHCSRRSACSSRLLLVTFPSIQRLAAGLRHLLHTFTAAQCGDLRRSRFAGSFAGAVLRINQILCRSRHRCRSAVHSTKRLHRINGKDFVGKRRRKRLPNHNARRIAVNESTRILLRQRNRNLFEKGARVARPVKLRNRPKRHIALHRERIIGIKSVQSHILADNIRCITSCTMPALLAGLKRLNRFFFFFNTLRRLWVGFSSRKSRFFHRLFGSLRELFNRLIHSLHRLRSGLGGFRSRRSRRLSSGSRLRLSCRHFRCS